ncbi:MAG: hydantoinase B/oxoprolinase family protein [Solirubrobacteraceae bacterium]
MTQFVVTRAGAGASAGVVDADPVTTEVIRHGLNSAATQMKRALIRTAFSPIVYEVLDFAVALYDERVRMLAQAPSLPMFMGRLSFCVENAVEAIGGAAELEPGDVILYNHPYGTGSHPQDAAVVMPVFYRDSELIGYAAIKAHWLDIGGKEPYATDTVDMFQEGTIFPGVKLVSRGQMVRDIYRMALANSRVPKAVAGDINAELVGVRTGAAGVLRIVERYGLDVFRESVERMFDHGEATVRSWFERIPDGDYVGHGTLDSDGISDEKIEFDIEVAVRGSSVRVDYSAAPDQRPGPVNSPLPKTVSCTRVAISMLAGGGEWPNEGHFRPIEIVTRPGSLFHPLEPAPTFIGGWAAIGAIDTIYRAFGQALPNAVPATSGGDICSLVWWGRRPDGEPWADGSPYPVGQGAHVHGDGANAVMHVAESATRIAPTEVWESRNPWLVERAELAPDTGGVGEHRGGNGLDFDVRLLEDAELTSVVDRTTTAPAGLAGGGEARPNAAYLVGPNGDRIACAKATRLQTPAGSVLELRTGGGGGFGDPAKRSPEAVASDVREGYVSEERARLDYPHAFKPQR